MASLNLMLPKEERKAMLLRLYNDDTPLIDHSQERRNAKEIAATDQLSGDKVATADSTEDTEDGGVRLDAEMEGDTDMADASAPSGAVGTEEDVLAKEDRLLAAQEAAADEGSKVAAAPEREGEDDVFNKTV